jgi:hypothetical protein
MADFQRMPFGSTREGGIEEMDGGIVLVIVSAIHWMKLGTKIEWKK